jgi:putative transposase
MTMPHDTAMTYPRYQLVDRHKPGFYHITSRCVRRAYLCGWDALTGRSFEHRKQWVEDLVHQLARCFTIDVYAYAVMSNHYHLVLRVDPERARVLGDREVAERWLNRLGALPAGCLEARGTALCADPVRLAEVRARLGDLSWFMRSLNETIARRANSEDECTGRFWEGRFQSKVLLDQRAVLAGMCYADLNPIRAAVADRLSTSLHTSIRWRLARAALTDMSPLRPVAGALPAAPHLLQPRLPDARGLERAPHASRQAWPHPRRRARPAARARCVAQGLARRCDGARVPLLACHRLGTGAHRQGRTDRTAMAEGHP